MKKLLLTLFAYSLCSLAFAEAYIGGAFGQGTVNGQWVSGGAPITKNNNSPGHKAFVGYMFRERSDKRKSAYGYGLEFGYANFGKSVGSTSATNYGENTTTSTYLTGLVRAGSVNSNWRVKLAFGLSQNSSSVTTANFGSSRSETYSANHIIFGAGIGYQFHPSWGVDLDYYGTSKIEKSGTDGSLLALGVRYIF
jgi:Outer membrane protein beta-barrel domain